MSADDSTRIRRAFPVATKDKVADALQHLESRRGAFPKSLGVKIERNPPYVPVGEVIAECRFGTISGMTRSLLTVLLLLPNDLRGEAATTVVCSCSWTPATALSHKTPSEIWHETLLGSPERVDERSCSAYKHVDAGHTGGKLEREARMYLPAGSSDRNCRWRFWGPMEAASVSMSAEVSFRDGSR